MQTGEVYFVSREVLHPSEGEILFVPQYKPETSHTPPLHSAEHHQQSLHNTSVTTDVRPIGMGQSHPHNLAVRHARKHL